jgi:hypothetical protein
MCPHPNHHWLAVEKLAPQLRKKMAFRQLVFSGGRVLENIFSDAIRLLKRYLVSPGVFVLCAAVARQLLILRYLRTHTNKIAVTKGVIDAGHGRPEFSLFDPWRRKCRDLAGIRLITRVRSGHRGGVGRVFEGVINHIPFA